MERIPDSKPPPSLLKFAIGFLVLSTAAVSALHAVSDQFAESTPTEQTTTR